jgi:carbonic anhydrase
MGHTSCGAVRAALDTLDGSRTKINALDHLLEELHPRLSSFKGRAPSSSLTDESWANAEGVANDILKRSKILSKASSEGHLWVVPALYELKNGKVTFKEKISSN